jgi:uncharacterized membrane protein
MDHIFNLPGKALRILRGLLRRLWIRVTAMGLLAVLAILGAQVIEIFIPGEIRTMISGGSVDRLLNIIASAMLTVTTFSLTVMVSTYQATASQFTPRMHQLIRQDAITQNTLATFIGAYVYALTAIVLREVGYIGDKKALVLFVVTVLVLALIVWSIIRWMLHLQSLGSLIDSARQVEDMTARQFRERLETPCLGATPLLGDAPDEGVDFPAPRTGYIQIIHPEPLQDTAEKLGLEIYLLQEIGDFTFEREPLVRVTGLSEGEEDKRDEVRSCVEANIRIGEERTYDQDPRFGLLTLSQIGSKALSPGINDPGTAIDVINRSGRVLALYRTEDRGETPRHPRLHARPLRDVALLDDAFAALVRDGAGTVEVQLRLQRVLGGLMRHPDAGLRQAARDAAAEYLARALQGMDWEPDRQRLRSAAEVDPAETGDL